jgi:hypothetical protein
LREVASGLAFLHAHGVCVGDISPKNLLFTLTPHQAVYFIDCDAMRINGVSALPQVETPGWEVPAGEELATIYSDTYKLGLLALRLLAGDQDTKNPEHLPSPTPALLRQLITDTLTNPPTQRPLPEAWTYVLGHAIEAAQHQKLAAAPVLAPDGDPLPAPPIPIAHIRPPTASARPPTTADPTQLAQGMWAQVVAVGDDYYQQIGRIIEICDDTDGLDVVLQFRGDPDGYAFRPDELRPSAPPAERRAALTGPKRRRDLWSDVGIDLIRIVTSTDDFLTLRCYLDGEPIFLGHGRRIYVFRSGPKLQRYLAQASENDMEALSTYDQIKVAAVNGALPVGKVKDFNNYVLEGLADDIAVGPDRVDREQLGLAVELLEDVGQYVKSAIVGRHLQAGQPLGDMVESVLDGNHAHGLRKSGGDAFRQWVQLEGFLESHLHER